MYKTLGVRWLIEVFCPASAFAMADKDEARNPQRFIHVTGIYQSISETSERTATRDLEFLTEIGVFEKVGEKKGTKYKLIRV